MNFIEEKISLFLGKFGIWTYPLKFYTWGRKIVENVEFLENSNQKKQIIPYLKITKEMRKKFLVDTPVEQHYIDEVENLYSKFLK